MNDKDTERCAQEIIEGRHTPPDLKAAEQRRDWLVTETDKLAEQLTTTRRALSELEDAAERSLVAGTPVDDRPLAVSQEEIRALESRVRMYNGALEEASRRVAELWAARAAHFEALLRPHFERLVKRLDAEVEAVVESERLLTLLHRAATGAIPSSYSTGLTEGGYVVFAPAETVAWFRERSIRNGLLAPARRVA